ncbi:hypothetical protein ACFL6Y_06870 [Elusimicrobiota bacterium]
MSEFWMIFGAWVAAGLTLCIMSFLFEDNPMFKAAEHLYIGISVGYSIILVTYSVVIPKIITPIGAGNLLPILPALLGIGIVSRFFPKISWVSRISFAFIMGYTSGLAIPTAIVSRFLKQLEGSIYPLYSGPENALNLWGTSAINGLTVLVLVVGLLSVLIYFFFSVEHAGPVKPIAKIGIYFIMIYLGAAFGTTVMGRFSLLYGRLFDLYTFRTGHYYYATPVLLVLMIVFLTIYKLKKKPSQ